MDGSGSCSWKTRRPTVLDRDGVMMADLPVAVERTLSCPPRKGREGGEAAPCEKQRSAGSLPGRDTAAVGVFNPSPGTISAGVPVMARGEWSAAVAEVKLELDSVAARSETGTSSSLRGPGPVSPSSQPPGLHAPPFGVSRRRTSHERIILNRCTGRFCFLPPSSRQAGAGACRKWASRKKNPRETSRTNESLLKNFSTLRKQGCFYFSGAFLLQLLCSAVLLFSPFHEPILGILYCFSLLCDGRSPLCCSHITGSSNNRRGIARSRPLESLCLSATRGGLCAVLAVPRGRCFCCAG